MKLTYSALGKKSDYETIYNPDKLFSIPRQNNRDKIGIHANALPFYGFDCWNHYEVSWLNKKGKPIVGIAKIIYGCDSDNIIESKSMKLYFNSFNNTQFASPEIIESIVEKDLSERLGGNSFVTVKITPATQFKIEHLAPRFDGFYLDNLDIDCSVYSNDPSFLKISHDHDNQIIEEVLTSDLLKSNCLVTNQPDWYSLQISYTGKKIDHENLLRYIVSFRNDNHFHEPCMEKIFVDIMRTCKPQKLTISGRSTRRGGIDVNSIRSSEKKLLHEYMNTRLYRQ